MYEEGMKGSPSRSDFKLQEAWKEAYMNRMRDNGKRRFGLLGIDRQDKEKRKAFRENGTKNSLKKGGFINEQVKKREG